MRSLLPALLLVACSPASPPPPEPGPTTTTTAPPMSTRPPLPVAPPTPGQVAVDRRGLPCLVRTDGLVACDRFGRPAALVRDPPEAQRVERSEEWTCVVASKGTACRRGDEERRLADRVDAGGRVVCNLGPDRLSCFGPGTGTADERVGLDIPPGTATDFAVHDGIACWLAGGLRCATLGETPALHEPDAPTLSAVAVGKDRLCGLAEGRAHCGPHEGPLVPVAGTPAGRAIVVGDHHACLLTEAGGVACWRHPATPDAVVAVAVLPLGDVVALDADGPFTVSLDRRRGLHRWRIGESRPGPFAVTPVLLAGLDNPTPPPTPECAGCGRVTTLGDERCVREPVQTESGATTWTECGARCCWVAPGWSL